MPTPKYSPETVSRICDAIAVNGLDQAGWEAGGIGKATFYGWAKRYPDFSDAVTAAKTEYNKVHHNSLRRSANKALHDYLTGSMCKVERIVTIHPDGSQTEQIKTIQIGVPRWAIERVLGKSMPLDEALLKLSEVELIPAWVIQYAYDLTIEWQQKIAAAIRGELPENEIQKYIEAQGGTDQAQGISDETWNAIRANVMGIEG
jgi:hypothetical protein